MNFIGGLIDLAQISLWMTMLVFMGIYILKPIVMFIPLPALYIAASIIFPTWFAFTLTYSGVALALTSGYYSGKFLGEKRVNKYLTKSTKIKQFLGDRTEKFLFVCFFYRILPLPFDLFNMMCGATGVLFWKYLVISLLGLSTIIIPNILAGAYITTPLSPRFLIPFGISLVITLSVFILYKRKI
jgi:uncharacterized membrane protein YdjX (TVP38/TMEM64 family)